MVCGRSAGPCRRLASHQGRELPRGQLQSLRCVGSAASGRPRRARIGCATAQGAPRGCPGPTHHPHRLPVIARQGRAPARTVSHRPLAITGMRRAASPRPMLRPSPALRRLSLLRCGRAGSVAWATSVLQGQGRSPKGCAADVSAAGLPHQPQPRFWTVNRESGTARSPLPRSAWAKLRIAQQATGRRPFRGPILAHAGSPCGNVRSGGPAASAPAARTASHSPPGR